MSDDTKALMEWLQGGVSESRAGRMYKRALDTIERLERDRDALAERCEKLHEALRDTATEWRTASTMGCRVCDQTWATGWPERHAPGCFERHAEGCLAAPKEET